MAGATEIDTARAARWRQLRRKIAASGAGDRFLLLDSLAREIRILAALAVKASAPPGAAADGPDLCAFLAALLGGGCSLEPGNPEWPGRDRIFPVHCGPVHVFCAGLAVCGFFPPERIPRLTGAAGPEEAERRIPGLERFDGAPERAFCRAWESAVESGKSKRRWLDFFGPWAGGEWIDPEWREAAGVWRTCVATTADAPGLDAFRDAPARESESAAGLTAVIAVSGGDSGHMLARWRDAGWETASADADDCLRLYDLVTAPASPRPLAVALAPAASEGRSVLRPRHRSGGGQLLGELSDEQFNAIMGESMDW